MTEIHKDPLLLGYKRVLLKVKYLSLCTLLIKITKIANTPTKNENL